MKKTLIAFAVLAACGAAMAQSTVTLYGVVDVGLAVEDKGAGSTVRMVPSNLNGNRWGLKGAEDLGGGLKAVFVVESGFSLDDGAQVDAVKLFNRESYLGIASGVGTVKFGRQMNAIYVNSATFDPFVDALAGDTARLLSYQGNRTDNAITYAYAANGFRGELQYALGEVAGNSAAGRTVGGFLGYKTGPVDVVLVSHHTRNAADTVSTKVTLLGGNYNFGFAKAFLTCDTEKGGTLGDKRHWVIGTAVPMGAGTFKVSYVQRQDKATADNDAHLFALGYIYELSKRTALYTSYGRLSNDSNSTVAVDSPSATNSLFNAGVRHSF